jgi:hypothetical protein
MSVCGATLDKHQLAHFLLVKVLIAHMRIIREDSLYINFPVLKRVRRTGELDF